MFTIRDSDGEKMCNSCVRKTAKYELRFGKAHKDRVTGKAEPNPAAVIALCEDCATELLGLLSSTLGTDSKKEDQ